VALCKLRDQDLWYCTQERLRPSCNFKNWFIHGKVAKNE